MNDYKCACSFPKHIPFSFSLIIFILYFQNSIKLWWLLWTIISLHRYDYKRDVSIFHSWAWGRLLTFEMDYMLSYAYWDGYIVNYTNITSFLVFNWTSIGCCALLYYDITKFNMLAGYFLLGIHEWDQPVVFYFCVLFHRGCCFREYTFKMFLLFYLDIS